MEKIILIVPYFGRFHNYFPFFLESCRNNPSINWLIVTNDHTAYSYPSNVKVIYTTFRDLKDQIQGLFPFGISLENPYKLCDYKPAYGIIFEKEISGYDFWGYCDVDIIFGNIRKFFTPSVLSCKEKILSRGHLSLYRNNERMNQFFKTSTDGLYKKVYTDNRGYAFDEWGESGISNYLRRELNDDVFWDEIDFDDILTTSSNFKPAQKLNQGYINSIYEYNNGNLFRIYQTPETGDTILKEEVLYVHFQKRDLTVETSDLSHYFIVPDRFINPVSIDLVTLKKLGKEKPINAQYFKIKFLNLKRRLINLLK